MVVEQARLDIRDRMHARLLEARHGRGRIRELLVVPVEHVAPRRRSRNSPIRNGSCRSGMACSLQSATKAEIRASASGASAMVIDVIAKPSDHRGAKAWPPVSQEKRRVTSGTVGPARK